MPLEETEREGREAVEGLVQVQSVRRCMLRGGTGLREAWRRKGQDLVIDRMSK